MFTENKRTLKRPHEEDLESASHYAQGSSNNSNQTQFTVTASQMPWVTDQPHQRPLENPFLSNDPRQISGSSRFSHSGQQCQRLARNTFVTNHPVQAPVQPFEGQIWDEIFTEVEDNNVSLTLQRLLPIAFTDIPRPPEELGLSRILQLTPRLSPNFSGINLQGSKQLTSNDSKQHNNVRLQYTVIRATTSLVERSTTYQMPLTLPTLFVEKGTV